MGKKIPLYFWMGRLVSEMVSRVRENTGIILFGLKTIYEHVQAQTRDLELAIFGQGPHTLAPSHSHYFVSQDTWFGMTKEV